MSYDNFGYENILDEKFKEINDRRLKEMNEKIEQFEIIKFICENCNSKNAIHYHVSINKKYKIVCQNCLDILQAKNND